jgi:SAM-dependent methyltransferase
MRRTEEEQMNMSEKPTSMETYGLGHTPTEIQRLLLQGQLFLPFTRQLLEEAGIMRGMQVLDLGCGLGDVSLLVAELVGEKGHVLGVDSNPAVVHLAQTRAHEAGLSQEFDAIVGRLILQYLPDRAAVLRRLLAHLRPGGVVAFQEYDLPTHTDAFYPPSPLWEQAYAWAMHAFQQTGAEPRMGMKLSSTFLQAGLPAPHLRYEAAIGSGPEWVGYEVMANVVRALPPLIVKFGVATAEEVGIETLADRLREENSSQQGAARMPAIVSAWSRIGQS